MIGRLYRASSPVLVSTRVSRDARSAFSSSAISLVRRPPQRPVGRRPSETQDPAEEDNLDAEEPEEDEALDRWLLAGEEKVNESEIRSYKNPYDHFRKNVAPSFCAPSPRNWLGRDVPFPLNPSFKPPIPLSDELRSQLYRAYTIDPELNSVRKLAARHHLSIKRVEAILRLKATEKSWKQNKTLQTGFTKGMEHLLGVAEATKRAKQAAGELPETDHLGESERPESRDRYDAEEADLQAESEVNDRARQRYQRLFWESVAEGEDPVMPDVLGTQRGPAAHAAFKGKATLVERAPGRPAIKFIDIGNAFVDQKEKERREREGARRSTLKARKRMREHGLHV